MKLIPKPIPSTMNPWHAGAGNGAGSIFASEGRMRLEQGGTTLTPIATVHDFDGERDANIAFIVRACNLHLQLLLCLDTAVAMLRVQAETARQYAKAGRDEAANRGLAKELDDWADIFQSNIDKARE